MFRIRQAKGELHKRPCRIRQAKGELHRARVQVQVSPPRCSESVNLRGNSTRHASSESVKLRGNSTGHASGCRLRSIPNPSSEGGTPQGTRPGVASAVFRIRQAKGELHRTPHGTRPGVASAVFRIRQAKGELHRARARVCIRVRGPYQVHFSVCFLLSVFLGSFGLSRFPIAVASSSSMIFHTGLQQVFCALLFLQFPSKIWGRLGKFAVKFSMLSTGPLLGPKIVEIFAKC